MRPPHNTLRLIGGETGRGEMWDREATGLRSLCKCRCDQGTYVARTIKTLVNNDRVISEVERVSIAARALPSEPSAPCLVAIKENKTLTSLS